MRLFLTLVLLLVVVPSCAQRMISLSSLGIKLKRNQKQPPASQSTTSSHYAVGELGKEPLAPYYFSVAAALLALIGWKLLSEGESKDSSHVAVKMRLTPSPRLVYV